MPGEWLTPAQQAILDGLNSPGGMGKWKVAWVNALTGLAVLQCTTPLASTHYKGVDKGGNTAHHPGPNAIYVWTTSDTNAT